MPARVRANDRADFVLVSAKRIALRRRVSVKRIRRLVRYTHTTSRGVMKASHVFFGRTPNAASTACA